VTPKSCNVHGPTIRVKAVVAANGDDLILQPSIPVEREIRRVGKNRLVSDRAKH